MAIVTNLTWILANAPNNTMHVSDASGRQLYYGLAVVRNTTCTYRFMSELIDCERTYQPYYITVGDPDRFAAKKECCSSNRRTP